MIFGEIDKPDVKKAKSVNPEKIFAIKSMTEEVLLENNEEEGDEKERVVKKYNKAMTNSRSKANLAIDDVNKTETRKYWRTYLVEFGQ